MPRPRESSAGPPSYLAHHTDAPAFSHPDLHSPPPFFTVDQRTQIPRGTILMEAAAPAPPSRSTPWPVLKIGSAVIYSPLVSGQEVKDHLRLLEAFRTQRIAVEELRQGHTEALSPADRYKVFLWHATYRFTCWINAFARVGVKDDDDLAELPLDVALAWHTLILNSRWYREDCKRSHPGLTWKADDDSFVPKSFPLRAIVGRLSLEGKLSEGREGAWRRQTHTPFDPLQALELIKDRIVTCPRCAATGISVPYVSEKGTGYAQALSVVCPTCELRITQEALGIGRLATDLAIPHPRISYSGCTLSLLEARSCIAGTLVAPRERPDQEGYSRVAAARFKQATLSAMRTRPIAAGIGDQMGWTLAGAGVLLDQAMGGKGGRPLQKIMSAYTTGEPFSVDLPSAILRQGDFIERIHQLGWTKPDFFSDKEAVLHRANVRYHAFLDLAHAENDNSGFVVPTLDIDLLWHTHMLSNDSYFTETQQVLGYFLDHDDSIEEGLLSTGYDSTALAWETRFGTPYSSCPCPRPAPLPPPTALSKFRRRLSLTPTTGSRPTTGSKKPSSFSFLKGTPHPASMAASHPSEHNSVLVVELAEARRKGVKGKGKGKERATEGNLEGEGHVRAFGKGLGLAVETVALALSKAEAAGMNIAGVGAACGGGGCGGINCGGGKTSFPQMRLYNPARERD